MYQPYEVFDSGFLLRLDLTVYARQAVMKALYRIQDRYIISYERKDANLEVYLESIQPLAAPKADIAFVLREIDFEMIRYDTMRETTHLRELLVGRALYATCVESSNPSSEQIEDEGDSWREDVQRIFAGWEEIPL